MNRVEIIGNLTRDVELRQTQSGKATCRFTVAVNRPVGADGVSKADYINVVCLDKLAENCNRYLSKGKKVGVSGKIQTGSYEKDGAKVYTFDVVADNVEFLSAHDSKNDDDATSNSTANAPTQMTEVIVPDDDLPF